MAFHTTHNFQGCLVARGGLQIKKWCVYVPITLAVEEGYGVTIYKSCVFDSMVAVVEEMTEGCKVNFSGVFDKKGRFSLRYIAKSSYETCNRCLAPQNVNEQCLGCMNEPSDRIDGDWKLTHKEALTNEGDYRCVWVQNERVICFVVFRYSPFYKTVEEMDEDDNVTMEGWRDIHRHSTIKFMKIVQRPTKKRRNIKTDSASKSA